jgi:hypothetical protein
MSDREFGVYVMENLELLVPPFKELRATGKLLPRIVSFAPQKSKRFSDLNTNHPISLSRRLGGIAVPFDHQQRRLR